MIEPSSPSRFFVACKRAPVSYPTAEAGARPILANGGTANVVAELTMALGADMVATAASEQDLAALDASDDGHVINAGNGRRFGLQFVRHADDVFDASQNYFFLEAMWPAMHNLWEQWREPSFDDRIQQAWQHFRTFNENYASALARRSEHVADPVFILQDYQLVMAPEFLRRAKPDSHVQLFIHCSWGSPDSWRVLPRNIRSGILESMCRADSVGFFCDRWARNFLLCVDELVEDAVVDWASKSVVHEGRTCRVNVVPLGFSPETIAQLDLTLPEHIAAWVGEDPLVVTYGRTDPVKNTPRAIIAFLRAVQRNPGLRDTKLLVRLAPNHLHVDMNRRYAGAIESAAESVRASLGPSSIMVIEETSMEATLACYARADVLLFTPITDGQNLGPFEGVMVNKRHAGLVVSEMAGSSEVLDSVATIVNPFDVDEQASAIADVLMQSDTDRSLAFKARKQVVERYTLQAWVNGQLSVLPE